MAFEDIPRPQGLKDLITPPNSRNTTGYQGAHVAGLDEWKTNLQWLTDQLGAGVNPNARMNGVLLPEGNRGGAVLGVAEHNGKRVEAFDRLFYDLDNPNSTKYLNKFQENLRIELTGVNDPARIAQIKDKYTTKLQNFFDFVKVQFLHQDILDRFKIPTCIRWP